MDLYRYKGKVVRVVDGDTVDAVVDVGFGITVSQRFRIVDFDAPESWRPSCEEEKIHGLKAKERAQDLLLGKELIFKTSKTPGIYGRYGATIWLEDGTDFKEIMISEGLEKREEY